MITDFNGPQKIVEFFFMLKLFLVQLICGPLTFGKFVIVKSYSRHNRGQTFPQEYTVFKFTTKMCQLYLIVRADTFLMASISLTIPKSVRL